MNKRGQFYLLAAIIIITVIVGIATVSNVVTKKEEVRLYDLKDELNIESGEVLEHGTFYGEERIDEFVGDYKEYVGDDKDLLFVYGDSNELKVTSYRLETTGEISIGIGGSESGIETYDIFSESLTINPGGEEQVIVTLNNINYDFELKPGQNFFFVISQELEGEQHIIQS